MNNFSFSVTQEVLDLGVRILGIKITGAHNTSENLEFETYKKGKLEQVAKDWQGKNYKEDSILQGFRDLHTKVGRSNRDFVASPENLLGRFLKKGVFPHINTIVDIYNLISIESRLALGAHDINYVHGNITLRLTDGSENFVPLGYTEPEKAFPQEYAYVDDENNIVCRLEVLQVEPTKITLESKDMFFIIQGNSQTPIDYIETATKNLVDLLTRFCAGEITYLNQIK